MERNMKSIEVNINVGADTANLSKMFIVFDAERPTEMFNGITQAVGDLEKVLRQNGILTKQGVGTGEFNDYVEYMTSVVAETENEISQLYRMRDDVLNSELVYKYAIGEMIEDKIFDAQKIVDDYYDMFEAINYVEVTEENINDFIKEKE